MSDLQDACKQLGKLTDRDVRIVYLPPMTVAAYQYEGDEPEWHCHQVVDRFVRESKLTSIKPDLRHFGFNSPNPVDETNHHGYEVWVTIPDGFAVPAPLVTKRTQGGLYAAHLIIVPAFEEWEWLSKWVEQSKYRQRGSSGWDYRNMWGLLEEQLNYYNRVHVDKGSESNDMQLDLLIPIELP
ncbi:hypothetical protein FACS1894184_07390 [Clostridia bacterium]|nr:hypothetical protein FACS1894184_07390 [Clostridia bacterium]